LAVAAPALDLYQRREALYRIHSLLRSVDNLRPDEALDELVHLFAAWAAGSAPNVKSVRDHRPAVRLSDAAIESAAPRVWPMFESGSRGHGGDLFQEIADVGVRGGMGQYFTPLPVAQAIAEYLDPRDGESWLDPFCGSGLLLGEIAFRAAGQARLFGIDRDTRVLHLAELESTLHHPEAATTLLHANALSDAAVLREKLGAEADGFDGVVTNPPFGAEVHEDDRAKYFAFDLARPRNGTPLEILGLEQSIRMLRPGGRLGIVLPQSVLSNRREKAVREWVMSQCRIDGVLSLPADTFGPFQGVSKASVLFATRKGTETKKKAREVWMGVSRSIGYDSTGRAVARPDVQETARLMREQSWSEDPAVESVVLDAEVRNLVPEWHLRTIASEGRPLEDLVTAVFAGRTPARSAYLGAADAVAADVQDVFRVLKVGDLTGAGIDWSLGDRSCVRMTKAPTSKLLQRGDIVTTAAAHHPRYIGAKVDIVDELPPLFGERVFACAELVVIRPDPEQVDPYALLLWLRTDEGRTALQACVTGQTAHLHPEDVGEIIVPSAVLDRDHSAARNAVEESLRLLRQSETALARAVHLFISHL
jgi:type I restriction enzyme M protein